MRILVTGGAGFIGSHLVDALVARGDDVRILDNLDPQVHDGPPDYLNPAAELVEGDVRDHDAVHRALEGVDRLVHLAAAVGVGQSMYEIERYTSIDAVEQGKGDGLAINLGTETATVPQVGDTLARELGVAVEPEIRNEFRAGDIRHCIADIAGARGALGFEPRVRFGDGMHELAGWLAGQAAEDRVAVATADLATRGLTR